VWRQKGLTVLRHGCRGKKTEAKRPECVRACFESMDCITFRLANHCAYLIGSYILLLNYIFLVKIFLKKIANQYTVPFILSEQNYCFFWKNYDTCECLLLKRSGHFLSYKSYKFRKCLVEKNRPDRLTLKQATISN